jgi:hypothetical protein
VGIRKSALSKKRVIQANLGKRAIVVLYDPALDDALAYERGARTLSLRDGRAVDERGVAWDVWGRSERGEQLVAVSSFDVMWFAWHAFFPRAEIRNG